MFADRCLYGLNQEAWGSAIVCGSVQFGSDIHVEVERLCHHLPAENPGTSVAGVLEGVSSFLVDPAKVRI